MKLWRLGENRSQKWLQTKHGRRLLSLRHSHSKSCSKQNTLKGTALSPQKMNSFVQFMRRSFIADYRQAVNGVTPLDDYWPMMFLQARTCRRLGRRSHAIGYCGM